MSRIRTNNVSGAASVTASASVNPITLSSATTNVCTWSVSPPLPLISPPDLAVLVLEPNTSNEEIVYLIGFVPGSTTGAVIRNAEPSAYGAGAITHTAVAWTHGPTAQDWHITRSTPVLARMAFR